MSLILPANSLAVGGYEIANSLRFNDGSSDYLNKTFSSGNRKTWTFSAWLKRSDLITSRIFCTIASGVDDYIKFDTSHRIEWGFDHEDLSNRGKLITNRVFRDVSAWYHIICAVDTTNATAGNRMRIYINGVEETSFATDTNPTLNEDGQISNANPHFLSSTSSAQFYDGYMSEVYFIDGQQLDPTSFGETDEDTGIWKPIKYTGTYGTNGFYLDFENSGSLGADQSGNGNNFTVNNLTSIDQTTDTPTNNFCTLNALVNASNAVLSNGNTTITGTSASNNFHRNSTFQVPTSGKYYYEVKITAGGEYPWDGIVTNAETIAQGDGQYPNGFYPRLYFNGTGTVARTWIGLSNITGLTSIGSSGTKMFAIDMDNGAVYIGANGSWLNNGSANGEPTSGASKTGAMWTFTPSDYPNIAICSSVFSGTVANYNFGNPAYTSNSYTDSAGYGNFEYAVPSGYYSLCTKNLAEFG